MPTKIEKNKLSKLLRETLGLAASADEPMIVNEPPVKPVAPTPSVQGSETGSIKKVAAFESSPVMRKLGKLLSKLSEDQQVKVYGKLKKSMRKMREQSGEEDRLEKIISRMINEAEKDRSYLDDLEGPSDADLEALEMGDEFAGEFEADPPEDEELDEDEVRQVIKYFKNNMTPEEMAAIDLDDPDQRRRLKDSQVVKVIAAQMGVKPSAISNIVYQFMEKYGARTNLHMRPSLRGKKKIPTKMHAATAGMVNKVADMVYDLYKSSVDRMGVYDNPLPDDRMGFENKQDDLLFRNYLRLFLTRAYGPKVLSVGDLVTNWHNLSGAEHRKEAVQDIADEDSESPMKYMYKDYNQMNDKQKEALLKRTHGFSEKTGDFADYQMSSDDRDKEDLSKHIYADIWWNLGEVRPADFRRDLMRAADLVAAGKFVGGQGWAGVVKKSDKAFEKEKKVAAKEEKAAEKAAEKERKAAEREAKRRAKK